ncbi:MAG: hypothetical protein GY862_39715 [Gammaproteobacteria bacterium]|nr:hypothetical protein [Gammaproteobacteria bacterium]
MPAGEVTFWQKGKLDKRNIRSSHEVNLGNVTAVSADKLEAPRPEDRQQQAGKVLAHQLQYRWKAVAPRLNRQKQELKKTVEKPVQEEKEFVTEIIVQDKNGKPRKEKRKEKRLADKQIKEQVSYQPPVYQTGGRKVVAVRGSGEFDAARKLIEQGIAESIVVRD